MTPEQKSTPGSLQPAVSEAVCRMQSLGRGGTQSGWAGLLAVLGASQTPNRELKVFFWDTIWIMVQLLNTIALQMGRTSHFHGKEVTALPGLCYKFPRVPVTCRSEESAPTVPCSFSWTTMQCQKLQMILFFVIKTSFFIMFLGIHCLSQGQA